MKYLAAIFEEVRKRTAGLTGLFGGFFGDVEQPYLLQPHWATSALADQRQAFDAVRPAVREIVARHDGELVIDGRNYGVKGHYDEQSPYMKVVISRDGADELAALSGLSVLDRGRPYARGQELKV